ncbi:MAG: cation:proton antiporter [Cyclobacteriaceae bacterium]|nr:cation:proton antiporter [Cyclobacteriaceae bacterium]
MITQNIYYDILLICSIIMISYSFGWISKVTKIPSVLLLIILGVGCQFTLAYFNLKLGGSVFSILQLLGIVGLIMIVLEAALDLRLTAEKRSLIIKAFTVALLALAGSSIALAFLIQYFLGFEFFIALIYSIPLSVMSSAIIIPSVKQLSDKKKEFMIYESTFSDILGIMLFYFVIGVSENATAGSILQEVGINIGITVGLSIIISYLLVLIFQRIQENAKLFLLISVLIALYAVGKMFHLSSLIVILVFGLILSNYKLFFAGKLRAFINETALKKINKEFHLVTLESAFVVRTFFFVVFGLTLDLQSLLNLETALISVSLVGALYAVRLLCLRLFMKSINPELFIAPRGLITVLLFFAIPQIYIQDSFSSGILLYSILLTGLIMTLGMIFYRKEPDDVDELQFESLEELDKELVKVG